MSLPNVYYIQAAVENSKIQVKAVSQQQNVMATNQLNNIKIQRT